MKDKTQTNTGQSGKEQRGYIPEPSLLVRTNSKAPLLGTFELNVTSILGHRDLNASLSSTARRRNTCQDLLKKQRAHDNHTAHL
jgi:hypothetical protein